MYTVTLLSAGLANGSLYALVALGLVLLYRSQDMVNWAHGEFFMAGAFIGLTAFQDGGLPYPIAFVAAVAGGGALGFLIERLAIRRVAAQPHVTLAMLTVGISILLKGIARYPFGSDIYAFPPVFGTQPLNLFGLVIAVQSLINIAVAIALTAALFLLFQYTSLGRQMRATQQNPVGATLVGVDTTKIYTLTWSVAAAIGAAAGMLAAPLVQLTPDMGSTFLLKGFAAAVLGGFGSAPGAIVGGFLIGVIEMLCGGFVSTKIIDVSSYVIIIAIMFVRPEGLFGRVHAKRV